ncbi:MAG: S8 family serine peptidase [Phycisphaerales bacterium]|nr:S8 family serine peptidase [Phycisphaerales bacterium]
MRSSRSARLWTSCGAVGLMGIGAAGASALAGVLVGAPAGALPGELIVVPVGMRGAAAVARGMSLRDEIARMGLSTIEMDAVAGNLRVATPVGEEEAWRRRLMDVPGVLLVEFNETGEGGLIPNDTFFSLQWHLLNTGQGGGKPGADMNLPPAWDLFTGSGGVTIAILDSGIDSDHPDHVGRIAAGGIDFVNEDNNAEGDHAHGTWVGGVIGARANNSFGVTGVDWACMMMHVKVLNANNGGNTFDLAQGLNYVATRAEVQIVNMSLINYPGQAVLLNAIAAARDAGKIVISCAGNGGIGNADVSYPGASPLTMSIGATTNTDARASFSGTGNALDLVAPGANVVTSAYNTHNNTSSSVSGCSFATPATVGVAGLLLGKAIELGLGGISHDEMFELLKLGAEDLVGIVTEDTPGRDNYMGWGRVNAFNSLTVLLDRYDCDRNGVWDQIDLTGPGADVDRDLILDACDACVSIADFDGSQFIDLEDYDAFIEAFEAGDDASDVDGSGFVDTDDFDFFVRAFEEGC